MIFFNSQTPNKYSKLKKLLIPYVLSSQQKQKTFQLTQKRFGKGDGSYVLAEELIKPNSPVLSYGIGDDILGVSFEQSLEGHPMVCYDGSIAKFPVSLDVEFISEYLTPENFIKQAKTFLDRFAGQNPIIKLDIEGHEYNWLTEENLRFLSRFSQVCLEVHSLIEEIPENWILEPQLAQAKKDREKVNNFFCKMNKWFHLFHIHANNHGPRYVDFPDSLELTYINQRHIAIRDVDLRQYPLDNLDTPNYNGREDYVLN